MPIAYILINAEVGHENDVLDAVENIEGVLDVTVVYGIYDVVVRAEQPSLPELKSLILTKVRKLPYVKSTITLVSIEGSLG
ncbi:MAG: Lrp/AsnC ligand binding domain-containing protein [Candidatus Hodarchaeota archaeon]